MKIEDDLHNFFAHSKTDPSGDKLRDPRRVYANPVHPEICPILALGIYLLCYKPDEPCPSFQADRNTSVSCRFFQK